MILQKLNNENDFEYKVRICNAKLDKELDMDWHEIVELLSLDCSSDHLRKLAYAYKEFSTYINNTQLNNISDQAILQEIEEKKLELEKEKIKMQDQRREWKKLVREDGRFEHLVNTMMEALDDINLLKPLIHNPTVQLELAEPTEAVLMVSDWHIGSKFKNAVAEYNYDVATRRINELLVKTIKYCKANEVETLHLELLGDQINGLIHIGSRVAAEEDVIGQLIKYQELISEFIYKLCKEIPYVKVYSVIGNHSRVTANIKESMRGENLERLVPIYLKARLQKVTNVEIVEDCNIDEGLIMYDVLGKKIVAMHGDLDKPNKAIDNIIKMFKIFPDEVHLGHYHHDFELTEYDMSVIINGSLQGTDTFAYQIRKSGQAMQKLHIYNSDGKLCTYKMILK